ncbi:hypothetical protein [Actinoplanes awajinensis]|uniref:Uncharacterized protein n=1 Tax=Actinoplanes awajinensis subsp. mycoplanecinus TaxID=135947 RepID=A0A101JJE5_9ACTN|nr:hypothetical protein [Actinoplanes awajinensis]KUL27960.1 hypothetical protein ADL15_33370 [Actinoplanes awajinensis subsp. mycoplanecinus]
MTSTHPDQSGPPGPESGARPNRADRRRERIRYGVQQARRGRHIVPTWLMATVLGLLVAGWLYLIITT